MHEERADELERDVEDGWVETTNPESNPKGTDAEGMVDLDDEDQSMTVVKDTAKEENDEEMVDLDDMSDDDNMFATPANNNKEEEKTDSSLIRKVRKYDLSITYDFYTQTPRLWLTGYSEEG